jgi:hypothetical protein
MIFNRANIGRGSGELSVVGRSVYGGEKITKVLKTLVIWSIARRKHAFNRAQIGGGYKAALSQLWGG